MQAKIRRALFTVSDKSGVVELAKVLAQNGAEIVATGRTASVLKEAGLSVIPIEKVSGSPEAFQGRMKTLCFPVCSGILYRRGDVQDEADLQKLGILPIDCVVVNFYPFEQAAGRPGISRKELVEEIDIGGPTLVRAAAKNAPDVLVLTDPAQYPQIISEIRSSGAVSPETSKACAARAWDRVAQYDHAIQAVFGTLHKKGGANRVRELRYGENPHQQASLELDPEGPIAWDEALTKTELSYNNILDLSAAYGLASDLVAMAPGSTGVVIVKHNNPCGVALVPKSTPDAQMQALLRAWQGDPVSAFGGVLVFTDPLEETVATWLSERFIELVSAPELKADSPALLRMLMKRRNLKAVGIRRFGELPRSQEISVPGGKLRQTPDTGIEETLTPVTKLKWPEGRKGLAKFGIAVCRALKSNAIALVREVPEIAGALQLVGAGQGQPNRVEALEKLAVPRALGVLADAGAGAGTGAGAGAGADGKTAQSALGECVMVSDAFFPFRDTVDSAFKAGIRWIVQPGGSVKDQDSIAACDEHGIGMVFTGVRHFRH